MKEDKVTQNRLEKIQHVGNVPVNENILADVVVGLSTLSLAIFFITAVFAPGRSSFLGTMVSLIVVSVGVCKRPHRVFFIMGLVAIALAFISIVLYDIALQP